MIKLGLHDRVPGTDTLRFGKRVPFVLTTTNVHRGYMPGRGLLYSILVHEIIFFGMLLLSMSNLFEPSRPPERVMMVSLQDRADAFYLPILGGGKPGEGRTGGGLDAGRKAPSVASAPTTKGFSYPGPQPILSDFPKPTNTFQTVLRPELKNPATLPPPLSLPNLVQIPEFAPPTPPVELQPQVKPIERPSESASSVPIDAPKLVRPALAAQNTPIRPPTPPVELQPQVKPIEPPSESASSVPIDAPKFVRPALVAQNTPMPEMKPPEPPKPPEPVPATPAPAPKTVEPLLTLSPTPAPPDEPVVVPPGEARGRFSISPEGNLSASETDAGSKLGTPASTAAIGSGTASPSGKTDAGNTAPSATATTGTGGGAGKDKDSPSVGTGTGRGSGVGSAAGTGAGSTTGTSSGPGRNPFPGITILGGATDTRKSAPPAGNPVPAQTSWGVMVVSTESSGGGLPSFGVFPNDQIYTVYLDMRKTTLDTAPSWVFEYAVLQEAAEANGPKPSRSQQGLVLPFPVVKELPVLPAELVRKYLRRLVIVYTIINTDGKVEQMTVKESPDTQLSETVLNALSKWVFRPAKLGGKTVPMKLLLGIPLAQ